MGPRSENRGYVCAHGFACSCGTGFNGSTVREPWLCSRDRVFRSAAGPLQWVHGPRTVVMVDDDTLSTRSRNSFNGSTVREPWLWRMKSRQWPTLESFNGSTVREPWLCCKTPLGADVGIPASMGPRSENRGYAAGCSVKTACCAKLQWVHGPRTVVMRTVHLSSCAGRCSFNGSTVREPWLCLNLTHGSLIIMCGFNGSTVREPWLCRSSWPTVPNARSASMGPRSENRGYVGVCGADVADGNLASMGPRSENRGYVPHARLLVSRPPRRFNGSTVREPWL